MRPPRLRATAGCPTGRCYFCQSGDAASAAGRSRFWAPTFIISSCFGLGGGQRFGVFWCRLGLNFEAAACVIFVANVLRQIVANDSAPGVDTDRWATPSWALEFSVLGGALGPHTTVQNRPVFLTEFYFRFFFCLKKIFFFIFQAEPDS